MGVDIQIGDLWFPNQMSFSVAESATPIEASDTSGGVSQITFTTDEPDRARYLINQIIDLEDGAQGTTQGIVRSLQSSDKRLTVTADSRLALLLVERTAQPYSGTLGGALSYYYGLCGITSNFVTDVAIASTPVVLQGFQGEVWFWLNKKLAPALGFEISLVSDNIVARPLRGRIAENYRDSSTGWSIDTSKLARSVQVYYYNNKQLSNTLAYPEKGWNESVQVLSVDAGDTVVRNVPISASLSSVQQPVQVEFIDRYYRSSSVYTVVGRDSLPITPAQWQAGGGKVSVAIGEDTRSLDITIVGSSDEYYGPYKIAMSAGSGEEYSSLRIVGTGVFFDKQLLTFGTGVDPTIVTQEIGATIDNENISSVSDACDIAVWSLARYGSPTRGYSATTKGINRVGDTGSYAYPVISRFNAAMGPLYDSIGEFNDALPWSGMTIGDFNDYWNAQVANDFANQAFGNAIGARTYGPDGWYRIRESTTTESQISYSAEFDTIISDFNTLWAGAAISDFNLEWGVGQTLLDFTLDPLRRYVPAPMPPPEPGEGYGSGLYGMGPYGG